MRVMDEIVQLIRQAKGLLERAERIALERTQPETVAAAQGADGFKNPESPQSYLRMYRFLNFFQKEGTDGVDVGSQRQLMLESGYPDTRASGGFFSGGSPSLRRDPVTDRRYLTEHGRHRIEEGRLRFGSAIEELPSSQVLSPTPRRTS
jgi:hypothetical protein